MRVFIINPMSETEILPGPPPCEVHHRFARLNGIRLHYVEANPTEENCKDSTSASLSVALHGFPEFWYSWRHQIPALAAAGFRVLAPDMRGYNLSDKPRGIAAYRIDSLIGDVLGLIEHVGAQRAAIIGHDWGARTAYFLASLFPDRISQIASLALPYQPKGAFTVPSFPQARRIWYQWFMCVEGGAETVRRDPKGFAPWP